MTGVPAARSMQRVCRAIALLAVCAGGCAAAQGVAGDAAPTAAADARAAADVLCTTQTAAATAGAAALGTPHPLAVLLLVDAPAALRLACRQVPVMFGGGGGGATVQFVEDLLDVAEAGIGTPHSSLVPAILDALLRLEPAPAAMLPAITAARLQQVLALSASDRSQTRQEEQHLGTARALLQAAGLTQTRRYAAVLVAQAGAWRSLREPGALDRAAAALQEAGALLQALQLDTSLDQVALLEERAILAHARQDLLGCLEHARQQLALYRQLGHGDAPVVLHVLATRGAVFSTMTRYDEALLEFNEGLRIIALHPGAEPSAALGILNNLATLLHTHRRQLAQALDVADRALALATQVYGPGAMRTLTPLQVRAEVLHSMANHSAARRVFLQAQAVVERDPAGANMLRRLRLHDAMARTLVSLGDGTEADALIARGLAEAGNDPTLGYWRGRLLRLRAARAAHAQDWAAADADVAEAIALVGAVIGGQNDYVSAFWAQRCLAQASGALPGDACSRLAQRLDSVAGGPPTMRFLGQAALANAAERAGRGEDALAHRLAALAAAHSAGTPDPLWVAYGDLAALLRSRGDRATAVLLGKQAVEQIERMRSELGTDAQRLERGFLANKLVVYRRLADWLTEDGRIDEALDVMRLLKQEELFDFVGRDGPTDQPGAARSGPAYSEREAAAVPLWRPPVAATPTARDAPAAPAVPAEVLRQENDRVRGWRALLGSGALPARDAGSQASPKSRPTFAPTPAPPMARATLPPPGEVWVWLYGGERRVNLVIDTTLRRTVVDVPVAPAALARDVTQLLAAIERREPVQPQLQALHALLAAPIEREAVASRAHRLLLTVDGPLRYLPFAALHDGRDHLGARYSIEQRLPGVTASAAAAVAAAAPNRVPGQAQAQAGGASLLALGASRGGTGMRQLDDVASEICGIVAGPVQGLGGADGASACGGTGVGRGFVRGTGWMNDAFTAARLRSVVAAAGGGGGGNGSARHSLLHIGTHFVLRPGRMGRSWLLLGDGTRLTLDELGRLDFSAQALVTLSACQTGMGGAQDGGADSGAEVDGLGGLLLQRGAAAVLASLWPVDDGSTSLLMQDFYRHLATGALPAQALRQAQAGLRRAGGSRSHPFHWAGFYLVTGTR